MTTAAIAICVVFVGLVYLFGIALCRAAALGDEALGEGVREAARRDEAGRWSE